MFYVALSRAQNLLILPRFNKGMSNLSANYYETREFSEFFSKNNFPLIPRMNIEAIPTYKEKKDGIAKSYSYSSDFIFYKRCPRQYMIMRKYDFVASRSETMMFGTLIHQTIEDLHNFLISNKVSLFQEDK